LWPKAAINGIRLEQQLSEEKLLSLGRLTTAEDAE
jgi:hypothetical protein